MFSRVAGFPNDFIYLCCFVSFRSLVPWHSELVTLSLVSRIKLTRPSPLDTVFYVLYTIFIQLKRMLSLFWWQQLFRQWVNYNRIYIVYKLYSDLYSQCFIVIWWNFFKFQLINDCQDFLRSHCRCGLWFITRVSFFRIIFCENYNIFHLAFSLNSFHSVTICQSVSGIDIVGSWISTLYWCNVKVWEPKCVLQVNKWKLELRTFSSWMISF